MPCSEGSLEQVLVTLILPRGEGVVDKLAFTGDLVIGVLDVSQAFITRLSVQIR